MQSKSNWVGQFKIVLGQASPYLTIVTALMMAATFYHTTLIEWMGAIGWNIPLWVFLVVVIIGGVTFLLFERKHMVSGYFEAWTEHWWDNKNPMRQKMEKLSLDMDQMKVDMAEIKKVFEIDESDS